MCNGQLISIASHELPWAACTVTYGLSARGPRAYLLDRIPAGERREWSAGDAYGGPGPGAEPQRLRRGRDGGPAVARHPLAGGPGQRRTFCALCTEPPAGHLPGGMAEVDAARLSVFLPLLA